MRDASCFAVILEDLVARIPGAFAAVLVDLEGEAVDYTGQVDPFELKLAAAHWQIVLAELTGAIARQGLGLPRSLVVRGARRTFVVHALPEGYALVVLLGRRAGFAAVHRAFSICERALAVEARWQLARPRAAHGRPTLDWYAVDVKTNRARRPVHIRAHGVDGTIEHDIEVLGSVMGLVPRERGFRVRTPGGIEFTLVREPGGLWYADDDVVNASESR